MTNIWTCDDRKTVYYNECIMQSSKWERQQVVYRRQGNHSDKLIQFNRQLLMPLILMALKTIHFEGNLHAKWKKWQPSYRSICGRHKNACNDRFDFNDSIWMRVMIAWFAKRFTIRMLRSQCSSLLRYCVKCKQWWFMFVIRTFYAYHS